MSRLNVAPVSVVIPCHSNESTVAAALDSVACQTSVPIEVIAVDDASTDGTVDRLRELAKGGFPFTFRIVTLSSNGGPGEARNAGWAATSSASRYVAFLDADDTWRPRKIAVQTTWLDSHENFAWSAHRCSSPRRPDRVFFRRQREAREHRIAWQALTVRGLLVRNTVATPTVMVRRDVGIHFRPGWQRCEDLMLWLDWLDAGLRGGLLEEVLADLGRCPGSLGGLSGDRYAMYSAEERVLSAMLNESRLTAAEFWCWQRYAAVRFRCRIGLLR